MTDAALVAQWIDPAHPLAGDLRLDPDLAREALESLARGVGLSMSACADGMLGVATSAMARALRAVSVERGADPRQMTLVAFGGAGPLFVCRLADDLGMSRAIVPPHAGVLSALGLASAVEQVEYMASVHQPAGAFGADAFGAEARRLAALVEDDLPGAVVDFTAECRYPGQGFEVPVPVREGGSTLADDFHSHHRARFGYDLADETVEIVQLRAIGSRVGPSIALRRSGAERGAQLETMPPGTTVRGPASISGFDTTVRLEAGWGGTMHDSGTLVLERI